MDGGGGGGGVRGLVSLLWLQSVYRLQMMPGLDKRSPIPPHCLDLFVTPPE